jgi:transposase InsO family protein
VARWRYDQIADALPAILTRTGRAEIIRELAHRPVAWPNGDIAAIPRSTAYRWIRVYNQGGLEALRPAERKDKGKRRARLPDDVVERALDLWTQDSDAGFTFLIAQLEADPELRLAERGIRVAKSTLQRRLAEHELYGRLLRIRKKERRRTRYVARRPHDIWHLDAKGAVRVALVSGEVIEFHVLTILDDASRDTLAWIVVPSPNLAATVRVFRLAAKRWGLPKAVYLDRASVFDSHAFRGGLANLGAHRIRIRPRNPEANGKIEAYHRCLVRWFTKRLPKQRVVDLLHLQQLLDGMIETLYRDHTHREIGTSPRAALAGAVSSRLVPAPRLDDAFRTQLRKKAHRKTGEVDLPGGKFIVPEDLFGQRLDFLIDPEGSALPVVVHPTSERHLSLSRAAVRPEDAAAGPDPLDRHGDGPLQRIYDHWQGKVRPNAEPGFGLPELFALLGSIARRHVPNSDAEAARVQHVWLSVGPVPKKAAERAFRDIERELGPSRPLDIYLDALRERVESQQRRRK